MKKLFLTVFLIFAVCSVNQKVWAQDETIQWDRDQKYDVYYQASEREVHRIRSVKIKDVKLLGDRRFLVCVYDTGLRNKDLYVAFEDIKSIIPVEIPIERLQSVPIIRKD